MKRITIAFIVLAGLVLSACATSGGRTALTADEVRATFVGHSWRGPSGEFLFKQDGTYSYVDDDGWTWSADYTMRPDGLIEGQRTHYRFYRNADGSYSYYHSRSRQYYPAVPTG